MFNIDEAKEKYYESIKKHVEPHLDALSLKREQLVYKNEYGVEEADKWHLELGKFIREVLLPAQNKTIHSASRGTAAHGCFLFDMKFSSRGASPTKKAGKRTAEVFDEAIAEHLSNKKIKGASRINKRDHVSYEHDCCREIKKLGWSARVTPGSGDQGVDILAEKGGLKVAFQCKLYNGRLVGNAAVQQVKSGGDYFGCDIFTVISNAGYSRAAKQLASSLGVELIHHSEIGRFLSSIEESHGIGKDLDFLGDYREKTSVFIAAVKGDVIGASSILTSLEEDDKEDVFRAAKIICGLE